MNFPNRKSILSLLLAVALVAGTLSGCQPTPETTSTTTPTDPPNRYIDDYPPDWIPPGWIEAWEQGWAAFPNDTYYTAGLQWAIDSIQLSDAWDISTGSGTIRVGVIDSGVDASHPDLQNRVNAELSESFIAGVSPLEDPLGHGTHVAGIIAAQGNNGLGSTGVCWDVEIVSLRVSGNNNTPQPSAVADAIESANSKGIHILNLSLDLTLSSTEYVDIYNAILEFDGLVVCAAGNTSTANSLLANNDNHPVYPSNMPANNLISVGASTYTDTVWAYSCYGATTVDIFAPGSSILNCVPVTHCLNGTCDSFSHNANGYHLMSGTSMAAPFVAGVAALLLSIHPELTAAELKEIIMNNADLFDANGNSPFAGLCVSGGRLNAYKALSDPSIHTFGSWTDYSSTYHARACITCGYTQYNHHTTLGGEVCRICGHSGPITASIPPALLLSTPGAQQTVLPKCA